MPIHEREYQQLKAAYIEAETLYNNTSPEDRLFVTQDDGKTQYEIFDYFPHVHYEMALEGYERILSRPRLNDIDELFEQW
ncbi:hypothetical protein GL213_03475 [Halogeometricum borinquense]|uniref:Uncharacterized protein n=1 Tax=Halogeometricum borinquense (strain ATCC 700274 / DSM 11551 / JCM 10706 / KCTC 4070 / PR3) TaxID=469382 RepID=E4NN65_HALBP|nr:hypothetical protein [Halogeometricum borinquense]ADQ66295.1 hypothetical protein Hbor_06970 [Halogeometricum borinquense DSM 11551]ELY27716.1 hypothetical protein C499_09102 [Halogeometricum borinquense DSM 11551]QIQ75669.1 hypothetical protein GL213_03475 [Halogeometricum borinquense]